jgi:hypothetical protein
VRIVALEEHFNVPSLVARIPQDVIRQRGFPPPEEMPPMMAGPQAKLKDLGAGRLADMDAAGITVQVLSVSGPGADLLPPQENERGRAFLDGLPLAPADVEKIAHGNADRLLKLRR